MRDHRASAVLGATALEQQHRFDRRQLAQFVEKRTPVAHALDVEGRHARALVLAAVAHEIRPVQVCAVANRQDLAEVQAPRLAERQQIGAQRAALRDEGGQTRCEMAATGKVQAGARAVDAQRVGADHASVPAMKHPLQFSLQGRSDAAHLAKTGGEDMHQRHRPVDAVLQGARYILARNHHLHIVGREWQCGHRGVADHALNGIAAGIDRRQRAFPGPVDQAAEQHVGPLRSIGGRTHHGDRAWVKGMVKQ